MVVDYRAIWKILGGKFKDGSADIDSISADKYYDEVLCILGCKENEDTGSIENLSINMMVGNKVMPSCEINFNLYYHETKHADNPVRVEAAISEAITQYGREIKSELTHVSNEYAIVCMNFETEEDAKMLHDLITEKYSELDEIYGFIDRNL